MFYTGNKKWTVFKYERLQEDTKAILSLVLWLHNISMNKAIFFFELAYYKNIVVYDRYS